MIKFGKAFNKNIIYIVLIILINSILILVTLFIPKRYEVLENIALLALSIIMLVLAGALFHFLSDSAIKIAAIFCEYDKSKKEFDKIDKTRTNKEDYKKLQEKFKEIHDRLNRDKLEIKNMIKSVIGILLLYNIVIFYTAYSVISSQPFDVEFLNITITSEVNRSFFGSIIQSSATFLAILVAFSTISISESILKLKAIFSYLFPSLIFISLSLILSIVLMPFSVTLETNDILQKTFYLVILVNVFLGYFWVILAVFRSFTADFQANSKF